MERRVFVVDLEGAPSSDGRLLPIEIGVSLVGGRTVSTLVRPEPQWSFRTSRFPGQADLVAAAGRGGRPAHEVARRVAGWLAGHVCLSDACFVDQPMLDALMGTAGLEPPRLDGFFDWLERARAASTATAAHVNRWIVEIDAERGPAHRAGEDSRVRAELARRVLAMAR